MTPYFVDAACKYSRLAAIIYQDNHIEKFEEQFRVERIVNHSNGTYAVIMRNATERIIVFKGADLTVARTMRPVKEPLINHGTGKLVRRYHIQFTQLLTELTALNAGDGLALVTVGHSAGCAMAVLTAQLFNARDYWCYGSARIANKAWWAGLKVPGYWFQHNEDTVTYSPKNLNVTAGGHRYYIIGNRLSKVFTARWIYNWIKYTITPPGDNWVKHHRADYYYVNLKRVLRNLK
jgi:hypothetical protein